MTRYVVRRVVGSVPLVLGIATIIFFVVHAAPGDPATTLVRPGLTPAAAAQLRANYGLDDPIPIRYVKWLGSMLTGDFGHSITYGQPTLDVVMDVLPNTLLLSACALFVAFLFGIVLGAIQAVRQYSALDSTLSVVLLFFYSMPSFWLALMLVLSLSLFARNVWEWPLWFPASGMYSTDYDLLSFGAQVKDRLWHLVLPTISLALALSAGIARYMRGSMLDVIRQDYVRTARAKGLPESSVIFKHALRNALIPIVTLLGLYIPVLFSGAVLIEHVFAWPGMGRLMVDAIASRDYPLVMACSFIFAILVVLGNLLADVLYAVVDPRIRHE
ncbi:MAG: ABC transporter permease [Gemmatimonadetes bacterium]|nr:ABC transporter permease [Gemmatimonadota bacterium]